MSRTQHKVSFLSGVHSDRIHIFFLLQDWLPSQDYRPQFTLLGRENSWMHPFPKGISAMWNANGLVQVLNSGHRVSIL